MKDKRQIFEAVVRDERAGRRRTLTLADRRIIISRVVRLSCEGHYSGEGLWSSTERAESALRSYSDRTLAFLAAQMRFTSEGYEYMGAVATALPEGYVHALRALSGQSFALPLSDLLRGAVLDPVLAPLLAAARAPDPADPAIAALRAVFAVISAVYEAVPEERAAETAALLGYTPAGEYRGCVRLASPALTELAVSRPGDAQRIGAIVAERRTDDTAVVEAVLGSASPALQSGAL